MSLLGQHLPLPATCLHALMTQPGFAAESATESHIPAKTAISLSSSVNLRVLRSLRVEPSSSGKNGNHNIQRQWRALTLTLMHIVSYEEGAFLLYQDGVYKMTGDVEVLLVVNTRFKWRGAYERDQA